MEISQQTTAQISMMRRERENHTVTGALIDTHTHTQMVLSQQRRNGDFQCSENFETAISRRRRK